MDPTPPLPIGLLLGAGASFETGMPLVWDMTAELKKWLTPEKLRGFNERWRSQGDGIPDEAVNSLIQALGNPAMHYESILGHLEVQYLRPSPLSAGYHHLYAWLIQMVYAILYFRHIRNTAFIDARLRYLEGIVGLAKKNGPLWLFSLNHDLVVECLAARYGVPVNSGFPDRTSLPRRNAAGEQTGLLHFEKLASDQFDASGLVFPSDAHAGINLIKIHGALDIFTTNDGRDLLKLIPTSPSVTGVIDALRAANEELLSPAPPQMGGKVMATNEIVYNDQDGAMQFLRRTLLSGAFKFDQKRPQVQPHAFLKQFELHLNRVTKLICIGYSFGDAHINEVLRRWLEFSGDRRLDVVGPGVTTVPAPLSYLAVQVTTHDGVATDYLQRHALSPLSLLEKGFLTAQREIRRLNRMNKGYA